MCFVDEIRMAESEAIMKAQRSAYKLILGSLLIVTSAHTATGQSLERDKIGLRTRLVLIDVLVTEKRTGAPVDDLIRDNFEVRDDRKPRRLTYFSANEKRPLALILVLDLAPNGPGRFLRQTDILESLAAPLSKLSPDDEVAIMATFVRGDPAKKQYVVEFTSDHAKIRGGLLEIPGLIAPFVTPRDITSGILFISVTDLLSEAAELAKSQKPESKVVMVYVSDRFDLTTPRDRQQGAEIAQQGNVTFSAILCPVRKAAVALSVPILPLALAFGIRPNGAAYFAEQTGGLAVKVQNPRDYAKGLDKIIEGISHRYTLGFELDPNEPDDGRLHRLEVKVKAADKSGKPRKLEVAARRGYFLPKPQQPVAQKTVETEASRVTTDQAKRQTDEQTIRQSVYDLHYSGMTGDIEGVKRLTAKRTLDLNRLFFDLLFKKVSDRGGGQDIPASSGDELFKLILGVIADASKGTVSAEQIRERARAKSECRIRFTADLTASIEYSNGMSAKAVFEDGRWKIDDTERLKEVMLKMNEFTPDEKERIRKY